MGSLDRPDQPDEPRRAEQADARGPDRLTPEPRELPDPDERGRYYEAMLAHFSGKTATEASPGQQPDEIQHRSYQTEVPRHLDDAVARVQEAEPRLSADAQAIEQENKDKYGGWLAGFEHRLKGEDRLKEKIAEKLEAEPRMTASEALREVADAIRYTYCFQPENYTRGYYDIKERFEGRGYEMYYSKNWWANPEYKGINTRWITQDGERFEVQFHTPDSFHAKHVVTHDAYERIRDPTTSRAELRELHAFQRAVSSRIQVPDGAADIPDYKKEGF